ncbi:hypothetical protein ZWY2020_027674 [Hordeum vulgare]|nr:hypothetical protein ZWY2020_027674 [Hordeum vulgare]
MVVVDGGACSVCFHDEQRMEEGMGVGLTAPGFLCLKMRSLLEEQLWESDNNSEHPSQVWKSPQHAAI